jgi:hypothetical protein
MKTTIEKLKNLHLALNISKIFDFIPDYEDIKDDDYEGIESIEGVEDNEFNIKLVCILYNGWGIDSIQEEIVELSKEFLKKW